LGIGTAKRGPPTSVTRVAFAAALAIDADSSDAALAAVLDLIAQRDLPAVLTLLQATDDQVRLLRSLRGVAAAFVLRARGSIGPSRPHPHTLYHP
jgi:hypothetical protein